MSLIYKTRKQKEKWATGNIILGSDKTYFKLLFFRFSITMAAEAIQIFSRLKQVTDKVGVLFSSRYLLLTNTAITIGLSCTGDALQQNHRKYKKERIRLDKKRSGSVALSGLLVGPFCHYWYLYLDRWFPGKTFRVIAKKLFVDQLICSPVVIGAYLGITSWYEGQRGKALQQELIEKGKTLYKADWLVWPAAQYVNFYFLPTRYRVLYDNTISFGFDCYFAHVKFGTNLNGETGFDNESEDSGVLSVDEVDYIFRNKTSEMEELARYLLHQTCCSLPYIHLIRTTVCNHKSRKGVVHKPFIVPSKDSGGQEELHVHLACEDCDNQIKVKLK